MIPALSRRLARPFRQRAKLAQQQGRWADALANLSRALAVDQTSPAIPLQMANMRTELEQFDDAEQGFTSLRATPGFELRAAIGLAGVAERRRDWGAAVKRWEVVLELMAANPDRNQDDRPFGPAVAMLHAATCRAQVGDGSGAERDLGLAMALDPSVRHEREAFLLRAQIVGHHDARGAYRLLKDAHRRYPLDRTILFELTRATVQAGDKKEAAVCAGRLLAMAPEDPAALGLIRDYHLVLEGTSGPR